MRKQFFANKLALILIVAAFLRFFLLDRVPPSLNWDEISMGYTAYSVAETGRDEWGEQLPIFFRSYGEWKSAVYIYLLVPFVKILGLNEWVVRLPSAIAGIIAVYLTYLIGRKLYSERVGLSAALLLAISPWHLVLSRPAFEANVSLTLILAGIHFFLQNRYLVGALMLGLAPHTYNSAKVVVPFLVLYLIWQSKLYKNLKSLAVFLIPLALCAMPLLLNITSGRAAFRYTQVGVTTDSKALNEFVDHRNRVSIHPLLGKLVFNKYTYSLHAVADNYLSYLNPAHLLVESGDHAQHHVPYFGILYFAEFVLLLHGLTMLKKQASNYKYLPVVVIALGLVPAALTRDQGHVLRTLLTLPGWQLLAGLGLATITTRPRHILVTALVAQALVFLIAYFWWYPQTYARDWQYGHKQVAEYLREHEDEYGHIVMTKWYGEPQLFLAFYNQWDPTWFQDQNKNNLRYESEGRLWLDQLPEYAIGKYTFKYLDLATIPLEPNTLYIGKFDDFFENPETLRTITFPDGSVAFHIVEGK